MTESDEALSYSYSIDISPEMKSVPVRGPGPVPGSSSRRRGRLEMDGGGRRNGMGGVKRRGLVVGFLLALSMGVAIYFRIWAMDRSFSFDDREALRRQFDRANMEAMDESAEWRMKYDGEVEKSRQCEEELMKVKVALASAVKRSDALRKENTVLQKQVESLMHKTGT